MQRHPIQLCASKFGVKVGGRSTCRCDGQMFTNNIVNGPQTACLSEQHKYSFACLCVTINLFMMFGLLVLAEWLNSEYISINIFSNIFYYST